jgi:hypothetical protein
MQKYLPDMKPDLRAAYVAQGAGAFYPTNGGLTLDGINETIQIFVQAGSVPKPIDGASVTNLTYIQNALGQLGLPLSTKNQ